MTGASTPCLMRVSGIKVARPNLWLKRMSTKEVVRKDLVGFIKGLKAGKGPSKG